MEQSSYREAHNHSGTQEITRMFIIVLTGSRQLSLSWARWIQSTSVL